jgi:hypothetical protein
MLSPFNLLLDVLGLPYPNRGVYQLEDLPTVGTETRGKEAWDALLQVVRVRAA